MSDGKVQREKKDKEEVKERRGEKEENKEGGEDAHDRGQRRRTRWEWRERGLLVERERSYKETVRPTESAQAVRMENNLSLNFLLVWVYGTGLWKTGTMKERGSKMWLPNYSILKLKETAVFCRKKTGPRIPQTGFEAIITRFSFPYRYRTNGSAFNRNYFRTCEV